MAINLIRGRLAKKQSDRFTPKPSPSSDEVKRKIQGVPENTSGSRIVISGGGSSRSRSSGSSRSSSNAAAERARQEAEAKAQVEREAKESAEREAKALERARQEAQKAKERAIQKERQQRMDAAKAFVVTKSSNERTSNLLQAYREQQSPFGETERQRLSRLGKAGELPFRKQVKSAVLDTGGEVIDLVKFVGTSIDQKSRANQRQQQFKLDVPKGLEKLESELRGGGKNAIVGSFKLGQEIAKPEVQDRAIQAVKNRPAYFATRAALIVGEIVITGAVESGAKKLAQKGFKDLPVTQIDTRVPISITEKNALKGTGTRQPTSNLPSLREIELRYQEMTRGLFNKKPVSVVTRITDDGTQIFKNIGDDVAVITQKEGDDIANVKIFSPSGSKKAKRLVDTPFEDTAGLKLQRDFSIKPPKDSTASLRKFEEQILGTKKEPEIIIDNVIAQRQATKAIQDVDLTIGKDVFKGQVDITRDAFSKTKTGDVLSTFLDSKTIQKEGFNAKVFTKVTGKNIQQTKPFVSKQAAKSKEALRRETVDFVGDIDKDVLDYDFFTVQRRGEVERQLADDKVFFNIESKASGQLVKGERTPWIFRLTSDRLKLDNFLVTDTALDFRKPTSTGLQRPVEGLTNFFGKSSQKNFNAFLGKDTTKFKGFAGLSLKPSSATVNLQKPKDMADLDRFMGQTPKDAQEFDTSIKSAQDSAFDTFFKPVQAQDFTQVPKSITEQPLFNVRSPSRKVGIPSVPKIPTLKLATPLNLDFDKKRQGQAKGYDVFIKEKGKYFKANKEPKNYGAAFNLGANAVDNSAAATFKVKPSTKPAKIIQSLDSMLLNKFRKPKSKKSNTFIEKNTFRIDSLGEVQGISAKGWIANRRKNQVRL